MRSLFKLALLFIGVYAFTSCSQDNFSDLQPYSQDESTTTRAVSDIFNVEEIALPEDVYIWADAPRGVDREGNFYFITGEYNPDYQGYIYKYDLLADTLIRFAPWKDNGIYCERFSFDENNNLCYLDYDYVTERYGIRRVRTDGNAITEQWFNDNISLHSMSAALNGNLFILGSPSPEVLKIYRLNANGVLSEVGVDVPEGNAIYKVNGAVIYLLCYSYWSNEYVYKLNTNTGDVEKIDLRINLRYLDPRMVASSYSKANLYTIKENCVLQLRPNAATDLVVGTIPSTYKNKDGQFVNTELLPGYEELFMNADATIFYTLSPNGFYKLTL